MTAQTTPETSRDRVRRLFIDPLTADGMRFKSGTSDEVQRKRLDQMADDLGYMRDDALDVLRRCMRVKGEGSAKVFWPSRVSIIGFANAAQPRPIEDIPGFQSWFASAAGREAMAVPGRLLAEYLFWCRHLHPPYADAHKRSVATSAAEIADRLMRLEDREVRGVPLVDADRTWLARARARTQMLRRWIECKGGEA